MRLQTGFETRKARIEIIPLIDVMFLLLVSFVYATMSMTVHRGIRVILPTGAGPIERGSPLVVTIDREDRITIDERAVTLSEAVAEAVHCSQSGQVPVLINGDRRSRLGVAVELLSRLRERGVERVSFRVHPASE